MAYEEGDDFASGVAMIEKVGKKTLREKSHHLLSFLRIVQH